MTRNEGTIDRAVRIALGLVLVALLFLGLGSATAWAAGIGLVLLATGLIGFCPLYRVFGIHTSRVAS